MSNRYISDLPPRHASWPSVALQPEPLPAPPRAQEGHVEVEGGRLWYWDTGGPGVPVVLSHPSSGSGLSWPYQQAGLSRAGHRVIAYSRRGHHGSTPLEPGDAVTGAADLEALLDALAIDRCNLVGAAGGGNAVLDFALVHPERVLGLVVLSSYLGIVEEDYLARCAALRPNGFDQLPHAFRELCPAFRANNPDGTRAWIEQAAQSLTGHSVPRQRMRHDVTWATLESLRARTLLMSGDADLYWPPPLMRMVAEHLPRAGTVVLHTSGHAAYWERPTAFNRTVVRFLAGHGFPRETLV